MRVQVFRGDRLRNERERAGMSQHELAVQIGAGPNQIGRYESGEAEPSAYQLTRLAKALDIATDYLLGLTDLRGKEVTRTDLSPDEIKFLAALDSEQLGPVLRRLLQSFAEDELAPQEKKQSRVARRHVASDS
jgi:transcriptional regulator with XRE-family HTH domain